MFFTACWWPAALGGRIKGDFCTGLPRTLETLPRYKRAEMIVKPLMMAILAVDRLVGWGEYSHMVRRDLDFIRLSLMEFEGLVRWP